MSTFFSLYLVGVATTYLALAATWFRMDEEPSLTSRLIGYGVIIPTLSVFWIPLVTWLMFG